MSNAHFLLSHIRMLEELGVEYKLQRGRKHYKLHLHESGSTRFVVLPSTPSGGRSLQNSLSQLKRTLRALQAETASQGQRLAAC